MPRTVKPNDGRSAAKFHREQSRHRHPVDNAFTIGTVGNEPTEDQKRRAAQVILNKIPEQAVAEELLDMLGLDYGMGTRTAESNRSAS